MNVDGSWKQKWNREARTSPCYTDKAHAVRQQCGWLLIQETCWSGWDSMCTCFYWWIPQFTGCSLFFPPARLRHLEMSLLVPVAFCCYLFLSLTLWNYCFLHTIQTPQPPHSLPYQPMQTFLCDPLILCCSVISLFWLENRLQVHSSVLCSHRIVEVLLCLWPLFISASWLY